MVAGRSGGGGEATILISSMEVGLKDRHGFVAIGETAPLTAGNVEEASGVDDVVALTNNSGEGGRVVAGGGKADAILELGEKGFNWCGRIPSCSHAHEIGIKLGLGDATVIMPEVEEKLKASDIAES